MQTQIWVDAHELRNIMPALMVVVIDGATHGERGVLRRTEFLAALHEFLAVRRRRNEVGKFDDGLASR